MEEEFKKYWKNRQEIDSSLDDGDEMEAKEVFESAWFLAEKKTIRDTILILNLNKKNDMSNIAFEYVEVLEQIQGTNDHPVKARIPCQGTSVADQETIMKILELPDNWYYCTACLYDEEQDIIPLLVAERPKPVYLKQINPIKNLHNKV